jgi:hypothetical protein
LDIKLTKDSSILLHAFQSLVLKINTKKRNTLGKLEYIHEQYFVEWQNDGRKPEKTQVLEDSSVCPETSTKNAVKEFHLIRGLALRSFCSGIIGGPADSVATLI